MNKTELGLIGGIGSFMVLGSLCYLQYGKKKNVDNNNNNTKSITPMSFNSQYWPHLPLYPENMKAPVEVDKNGRIVKGDFTYDDPFPLSPSINRDPDLIYNKDYVASTLYGKDILGTGKGSKRKYMKNKSKKKGKKKR